MKLILKAFVISLLTVLITILLAAQSRSPLFTFLFPEALAMEDFDFTDYIYSSGNEMPPDTQIVLVNIGNLKRPEIAKLLKRLVKEHPRVIALNAILVQAAPEDDTLIRIMQSTPLVLPVGLNGDSTFLHSHNHFLRFAHEGHTILRIDPYETRLHKTRFFPCTLQIKNESYPSFAVQIARMYSPALATQFEEAGPNSRLIDYRGNLDKFYYFDHHDLVASNSSLALVRDKIVILGFMGETTFGPDLTDRHFTPLNQKILGLTVPDMYATVVQANIVSMILSGVVIRELGDTNLLILSFLACFVHVMLLIVVFDRYQFWYDFLSICLLIIQLLFFSLGRIILFKELGIKADFDMTIGTLTVASVLVSMYHIPAWNQAWRKALRLVDQRTKRFSGKR